MSNYKTVWVDGEGDSRKAKEKTESSSGVSTNFKDLCLNVRRLTSGKGRTVVEISSLPNDKKWCKDLAKTLKKKLGVGGTFKDNFIEIHGEKLDDVTGLLDQQKIKWKKTGG